MIYFHISTPKQQAGSLVSDTFFGQYHIKFVVAHLGGPLPFYLQRFDDNYEHWDAAFPDKPSKLLKKMWFDTANFHEPALVCAAESLGAGRLLLGSDYPYFQDELYTRAVTYVKNARLPDDDVERMLSTNAKSLLSR